jgi:hypothetical protein
MDIVIFSIWLDICYVYDMYDACPNVPSTNHPTDLNWTLLDP